MLTRGEIAYLERRWMQERHAAHRAHDLVVKAAHSTMADHYERRLLIGMRLRDPDIGSDTGEADFIVLPPNTPL